MPDDRRHSSRISTLLQLVVWSIVVGIVLSALGMTPANVFQQLAVIVRRISDLGFGAVHWVLEYLVLGAVIVVPVWLIMTLLRGRGDQR